MAINKVPNVDNLSSQTSFEGGLQSEVQRQSAEAQGVIKKHLKKDADLVISSGSDAKAPSANPIAYQPLLEMPKLSDMEDITRTLAGLQQATQEERLVQSKENIRQSQVKHQELHKERIEQIDEAIKKQEEAKEKSFWGKVFGWVATAVSVVVSVAIGALLIALTPVLGPIAAIAGGLLIASAALQLTAAISAETGDWLNEFVADALVAGSELLVSMGIIKEPLSHEDAMKAAPWVVTGAIIIMAIPSMFVTGGSSSASVLAGLGASRGVQIGATLAKGTAQGVAAGSQIAQGLVNMSVAKTVHEAEMLRALGKEIEAAMEKIMFYMKDQQEIIKKILQDIEESGQMVADALRTSQDSKSYVNSQF